MSAANGTATQRQEGSGTPQTAAECRALIAELMGKPLDDAMFPVYTLRDKLKRSDADFCADDTHIARLEAELAEAEARLDRFKRRVKALEADLLPRLEAQEAEADRRDCAERARVQAAQAWEAARRLLQCTADLLALVVEVREPLEASRTEAGRFCEAMRRIDREAGSRVVGYYAVEGAELPHLNDALAALAKALTKPQEANFASVQAALGQQPLPRPVEVEEAPVALPAEEEEA